MFQAREPPAGRQLFLAVDGPGMAAGGAAGPAPGHPPRTLAFGVALFLMVFLSGGLIMGTAPFQGQLVANFGYTEREAETAIAQALEVFVFGSAVLASAVDTLGPRLSAFIGLLVEAGCLFLLTRVAHLPRMALPVVLGSMGIGGNLFFYSTMCFPMLFRDLNRAGPSHDGLLTTVLTAGYQLTGFVFACLTRVGFVAFFQFYSVFAFAGALVVLAYYPNEPYTSNADTPRLLHAIRLPACRGAPGGCRSLLGMMAGARTWLFLAGYGLAATCSNWGLSIIYGLVSADDSLVQWMPIIANSTFVFSPCLGAVIDSRGFAVPVFVLGLSVVTFCLAIWLLPLSLQWLTLVALNVLLTHVYCIQCTYLNKTYPPDRFGILMSISCLVQSAVNPLSLVWSHEERGRGSRAFIALTVPVCLLWAYVQGGLRARGTEMHVKPQNVQQ